MNVGREAKSHIGIYPIPSPPKGEVMANKPLPEVACSDCFRIQTFTGQKLCKSCGKPLRAMPYWKGERVFDISDFIFQRSQPKRKKDDP